MARVPRILRLVFFLVATALLLIASFRWVTLGTFSLIGHEPSVDDVLERVAKDRAVYEVEPGSVDFGGDKEINVLVLGLDARKGWESPHCDAIHMLTLNVEDWSMRITSVPRGTYAYIPQALEETQYYIANACAYEGVDYGVAQIEKVVGVKADYRVTMGFSQVLGIIRQFDLPTTETLQFLRHRQSFQIGDPQRSHNQALFMKDLIVNQLNRFRGEFTDAMVFVLYNMVSTDMDYPTAKTLFDGFVDAEIDKRPDDIDLVMRPHFETFDYHYDPETWPDELERRLNFVQPYLSKEDLSGATLESIQTELITYLEERLESDETLEDVVEKQLWLQVEDAEIREDLHYRILEEYIYEFEQNDEERAIELLTAYIVEKETFGEEEYAKRAKGLLNYIVD